MCDESGDDSLEQSFHAISKRAKTDREKTTRSRSSKSPEVATKHGSSSSSTTSSPSSSRSEDVAGAQTPEPPVPKRMRGGGRQGGRKGKGGGKGKGGSKGKGGRKGCRKGRGKGMSSRTKSQKPLKRPSAKKTSDRNSAKEKRSKTNHQETQNRLDGFKVSSLEPLKWAEKFCLSAANHGGVCPYDSVDIFTEFSGSTCAESAVEAVVNHMSGKPPSLNFCYNADVKSSCRQVAMSTRHVLGGCSSHQ